MAALRLGSPCRAPGHPGLWAARRALPAGALWMRLPVLLGGGLLGLPGQGLGSPGCLGAGCNPCLGGAACLWYSGILQQEHRSCHKRCNKRFCRKNSEWYYFVCQKRLGSGCRLK